MRFDKILPTDRLKPYVKYFIVSENDVEAEYKVLPSSGLVIRFQYSGQLVTIKIETEEKLTTAGITGLFNSYKIFKNSANIGTILVYFTEIGFMHFTSHPANELFNQSVSLEHIFDKNSVNETEEKLIFAPTTNQRIHIVEQFLLSKSKEIQTDRLIIEAVNLIYQTKGTIRIRELDQRLFISQSSFEKRFRKLVGITPKKFASIVLFSTYYVLGIAVDHTQTWGGC